LQTKLKRKRFEHRDNDVVRDHQLKFSRPGSGRPVKRKLGETTPRDRHKQVHETIVCFVLSLFYKMMMISSNDESSEGIQTKLEKLRDASAIDINTHLRLWKETLHVRRQSIRDRAVSDILKDFPGYSNPVLVEFHSYHLRAVNGSARLLGRRGGQALDKSRPLCGSATTSTSFTREDN
jgi:hypothetical protein